MVQLPCVQLPAQAQCKGDSRAVFGPTRPSLGKLSGFRIAPAVLCKPFNSPAELKRMPRADGGCILQSYVQRYLPC